VTYKQSIDNTRPSFFNILHISCVLFPAWPRLEKGTYGWLDSFVWSDKGSWRNDSQLIDSHRMIFWVIHFGDTVRSMHAHKGVLITKGSVATLIVGQRQKAEQRAS
jgi:hypothetical protein